MPRKTENWLDAYIAFSQFSEAPENFHFWTGVSTLAGALRRHVWIDMGYFQWTPCFYIVFVAPPGIVSKSTTANIGMNLLREIPHIHFGPDAVTWQALIQSLASSTIGFDYRGELHAMSAMTIVSSEFGTFLNPADREMVDALVSLWDGQIGTFWKATKMSGDDRIINPWVNLLACTTPSWIQANFPEYMVGGGFASRTIFVYGDRKRKLVAYPADHFPPDHEEKRRILVDDLGQISDTIVGPYRLTPEASLWGERWYEELYETHKETMNENRFAGYIARKQTHLHKLAMVVSASYKDCLEITAQDMIAAEQYLTGAEHNQEQVFSKIVSPDARASSIVMDVIRRRKQVLYDELYRSVFSQMSFTQYEESIEACKQAGYVRILLHGTQKYVEFQES